MPLEVQVTTALPALAGDADSVRVSLYERKSVSLHAFLMEKAYQGVMGN